MGKLEQIVKKKIRNIEDNENKIKMEISCTNRGEFWGGGGEGGGGGGEIMEKRCKKSNL